MRKTYRKQNKGFYFNHWLLQVFTLVLVLLCANAIPAASYLDELNHPVQLKNTPPQRIISLAPNITEILYAIGADKQIIGVTDYCLYPPQAKSKEKVGGFINPNLEKIVSLKPDLLLISADSNQEQVYKQLVALKIPVYVINPDNLENTFKTIQHLGTLTGHTKESEVLVKSLIKRLTRVRTQVAKYPAQKVLFLWSEDPLISAGAHTFTDNLITLAGGINIASDAPIKYPKYSLEMILQKKPDVIISASMGEDVSSIRLREKWGMYPSIPAVKNNRLYQVNPDLFARPAPSILDGLETLANLLHPEIGKLKK